jgi:V/A-type H+-transporting ATPase subunit K
LILLLVVGVSCFVSALYQGKVCAAGIRSIADDRNVLANGIVSAAMPETYAVLGFVSVFLF